MTDKVSKRTAASLAAVAVAAMAWMAMPATAQQQAAVSDQTLIGPGKTTYAQKCSHCHGPNMVTAGTVAPDLRAFPDDNTRFIATVIHADASGPTVVATGSGPELTVPLAARGAYRVEITMVPHHLAPYLGDLTEFAGVSLPWIYASPIYVQ